MTQKKSPSVFLFFGYFNKKKDCLTNILFVNHTFRKVNGMKMRKGYWSNGIRKSATNGPKSPNASLVELKTPSRTILMLQREGNKYDQKPRSTLLQDYIKSNKLDHKWTAATLSCAATPTSSTISEDTPPTTTMILQELSESTTVHDSPPSHFTHTCDEELLFMQNLFPKYLQ